VIQIFEGKFGLYIKCGSTNASLPKDVAPDALTLEQAVAALAEKKSVAKDKKKGKRGSKGS
jgi:DNA topoisomerase-1